MAKQFWVGDYFVDTSRNQISHQNQTVSMAPKALSVLTLLAENQGTVVSQDQILDSVWSETVVTPNTLQRSIAQLRKAFSDDAKQQAVIKTHAKQGYSLELTVKWQTQLEEHAASDEAKKKPEQTTLSVAVNKRSHRSLSKILIASITLLVTFALVANQLLDRNTSIEHINVTDIKRLTATDQREFNATYSNDGQFAVFKRYHQYTCTNRLWARNLKTQAEILLTPDWGDYGHSNFSPDGKHLAFVQKQSCKLKAKVKNACYHLKSLDFSKAIQEPGPTNTTTLVTCADDEIYKPHWLSSNELVLLHRAPTQSKLVKYSIEQNKTEVLYQPQQGQLYYFDHSPFEHLLAAMRLDQQSDMHLDLLNLSGELISSYAIEKHAAMPNNRRVYPNFVADKSALIFSTGRQLFTLNFQGAVKRLNLPLDEPMSTPIFNHEANKALATKGFYNSDIGTFKLAVLNSDAQQQNNVQLSDLKLISLARTNNSEDEALFRPHSEQILFESGRSGNRQLWLMKQDTAQQLTNIPLDSLIRGFRWAKDGNSVLYSNQGDLVKIDLVGQTHPLSFEHPVGQLFQWDSEQHSALAMMHVQGVDTLAKIDLSSGRIIKVKEGAVHWAQQLESGDVIYLDQHYQFWQATALEHQLISSLQQQGSYKRFILMGEGEQQALYGINTELELWRYDVLTESLTVLGKISANIDHITDIKGEKVLLSYVVAAKKEIVELSF